MRQIVSILIFSIISINCFAQGKYFEPSNIVDKTLEYQNDSSEWKELANLEKVDEFTRIDSVIFCGEIYCDVEPMKGLDLLTFKVLAGSKYAKDKNQVYYPIEIGCIDYVDCGVCYCSVYVVENANPFSFKYLSKDYASDGKNVYFRGKLIENANGVTFKVIDGPEFLYFAVDNSRVYRHNKIFPNADPKTFYYDKTDTRNIDTEFIHEYVIGDKDHEWKFVPPDKIIEIEKN